MYSFKFTKSEEERGTGFIASFLSKLIKIENKRLTKEIVLLKSIVKCKSFMYKYTLACLSVCLSVCINKRQNGWTDWAQILCGTSYDPREGLWILEITKCVSTSLCFCSILKNAWKNIMKSANFCCHCFTLYKEKMLTDRATNKSWNQSLAQSGLKS